MKVLAVLVLAVFTGCHANLLYADAPKPQLEVLTDAFWDYVGKATKTADDSIQMIRSSQFGQDVSARLTQGADIANEYAVSIQKQLPQELIAKVTTEVDGLRERLTTDLETVRDTVQPYTDNAKAMIQQTVEQLKQELAQYTDTDLDTETLKGILLEKTEELKTKIEQSMENMKSQVGSYTDDLIPKVSQQLQDFRERVAPMTEKVQNEFTQRTQQVREMATQYVEELRSKLDPHAEDLQARVIALYESYVKTN